MGTRSLDSTPAAFAWYLQDRHIWAKERHKQGIPVAGVTSNTVPRELLEAAGFFPVLLSPPHGGTPVADEFMEDVFDARTKSLFDFLASGAGEFLKLVVIPRTSEQEHKLFLYLREVVRQGSIAHLPGIYLYNLLHTQNAVSREYSRERTLSFKKFLEELTSTGIRDHSLWSAIALNNRARKAARDLIQLRKGKTPRLAGAEALTLLGARYFMDATEYAELASAAVQVIAARPAIERPRLLIKGFPLDHSSLHNAVEANGGIVVAEDDWWGSRSASADIPMQGDPIAALFEHYYTQEPSPRILPRERADTWFEQEAPNVDGVVFYLPPDDDVAGWDYPRQKRFLDGIEIPSIMIRADARNLSGEWHGRIAEFISRLEKR
jgi:benzoyl-CoA reductase/2-hydroxyglutaryl-CoA dehydratase subunit BcrC/BadD/HgdB